MKGTLSQTAETTLNGRHTRGRGYGIRYQTHSRVVVNFFYFDFVTLQIGIDTNLHGWYPKLPVCQFSNLVLVQNLANEGLAFPKVLQISLSLKCKQTGILRFSTSDPTFAPIDLISVLLMNVSLRFGNITSRIMFSKNTHT